MPRLEEFDRQLVFPGSTRPIVSMHPSGTFGLNRAANEALERPTAVTLLWGRKERIVGFRPSDTDDPNAYAVQSRETNGGCRVAGSAFFKKYGIASDRCRRFTAHKEDGDLLFYLDHDELT